MKKLLQFIISKPCGHAVSIKKKKTLHCKVQKQYVLSNFQSSGLGGSLGHLFCLGGVFWPYVTLDLNNVSLSETSRMCRFKLVDILLDLEGKISIKMEIYFLSESVPIRS